VHLVSAFQHSVYLELAIIDLEQIGISKEDILALPLDKNGPNNTSVRTSHKDGTSMVDLVFILSSIFMLLGAIYGFVLKWGPILWGLIGIIVGALIGLAIELLLAGMNVFKQSLKLMSFSLLIAMTVRQRPWSEYCGITKPSELLNNPG
jgi:hypothetical protein